MEIIDNKIWNELDKLDDNDSNGIKIKNDNNNKIIKIWNKFHEKEKFKKKLFNLVSLQKCNQLYLY